VNFGRYLVPIKQRVEVGQKWAKMRPEMLKFNICFLGKRELKGELKRELKGTIVFVSEVKVKVKV